MRYTTAAFSETVLQTGLLTAEYSLKKQQSTILHIFEPAFISGLNLFIKTVQSPAKKQQLPSSAFFFLYFSFYAKEKADSVESALLERKTRFELATLALARRCSTTEPLPHMVEISRIELLTPCLQGRCSPS